MCLEGVTQEGAAAKRRNEPKKEKTWHLAEQSVHLGGHDPSCVQVGLKKMQDHGTRRKRGEVMEQVE